MEEKYMEACSSRTWRSYRVVTTEETILIGLISDVVRSGRGSNSVA